MVEQLLTCAGNILAAAKQREASLKSLIYDSEYRYKQRLTAVTMETQRYLPIIEELLAKSGAADARPLASGLLEVVTYELLFGKGLKGSDVGGLRKAIRPYQRPMKDYLKELREAKGAVDNRELLEKSGIKAKDDTVPRYVRVNVLKNSYEEMEAALIEMGYTCVVRRADVEVMISQKKPAEISAMVVEYINSLGPQQFMADLHLSDVAILPPSRDIFQTSWYRESKLITMDKASCIPAIALAPPAGSHVIDTCAAPGNKTNHLACLMKNTGKIFAFDMDKKRTATLERLLAQSGVTNVETQCADFLEVDPDDPRYAQVSHVLVDPSCSGSGIVSRKDHLTGGEGASRKRLKLLRGLQLRILSHVLKFPSVQKVVYSTCSVHREENEEVVWRILREHPELALTKVMPSWNHRPSPATLDRSETSGEDGYQRDEEYFQFREKTERQMSKKCVRASFEEDRTNGFFVALFERKSPDSSSAELGKRVEVLSGTREEEGKDGLELEGVGGVEVKRKKKNRRSKRDMEEEGSAGAHQQKWVESTPSTDGVVGLTKRKKAKKEVESRAPGGKGWDVKSMLTEVGTSAADSKVGDDVTPGKRKRNKSRNTALPEVVEGGRDVSVDGRKKSAKKSKKEKLEREALRSKDKKLKAEL